MVVSPLCLSAEIKRLSGKGACGHCCEGWRVVEWILNDLLAVQWGITLCGLKTVATSISQFTTQELCKRVAEQFLAVLKHMAFLSLSAFAAASA